ncbi:MAG: hypothetical protein Q8K85_11925, partial [Hyphomicrobium sp.]|nr:hypothetical protein [Hyphomicrobium sp.]
PEPAASASWSFAVAVQAFAAPAFLAAAQYFPLQIQVDSGAWRAPKQAKALVRAAFDPKAWGPAAKQFVVKLQSAGAAA